MATIETKYSIGDVVYQATTATELKQHPCPDCGDTRKWKAVSPAGNEYEFPCPRCSTSYQANDPLSLKYSAHVPCVNRRTIGSVRFDSESGHWGGTNYMCVETGVGGGTIYREEDLFDNEADATRAAEVKAAHSNVTVKHIVERYNKTLELSDYQFENALLKDAADQKSRAGPLLWNLNDLFAAIDEASDKDAIMDAVDEYKRWYLERDVRALAPANA